MNPEIGETGSGFFAFGVTPGSRDRADARALGGGRAWPRGSTPTRSSPLTTAARAGGRRRALAMPRTAGARSAR